jgi:hypothetical protein
LNFLKSEEGFQKTLNSLYEWVAKTFHSGSTCSTLSKEIHQIHTAGSMGLAPEFLETVLFFPDIVEAATSVWKLMQHILDFKAEDDTIDKWVTKLIGTEQELKDKKFICTCGILVSSTDDGISPAACKRLTEELKNCGITAKCEGYLPAAVAALSRAVDKLGKSQSMRDGYAFAALNMALDLLGKVEDFANTAKALFVDATADSAAQEPAGKRSWMVKRKSPEYIKCPSGSKADADSIKMQVLKIRVTIFPPHSDL